MGLLQNDRRKEDIRRVLAGTLRKIFDKCSIEYQKLQEIRLRVDEPLIIQYKGKKYFVDSEGSLKEENKESYIVTKEDIDESLEYICDYSMYAFEEEMKQGYITVRGGHRVGLAGKMVYKENASQNMKYISCLNIRVAHEVPGCSRLLLPYIMRGGILCHSLIISPPGCGKTTILRDLVCNLSNGGLNRSGMTVGVVDERSEIGACYLGIPQNDLGCRTDILDACPKVKGMMMLVRSMAPQVIAVDEVGSSADMEAMEYVMNSGIKLLATVHGRSMEEIRNKPILSRMVSEKRFERYIVLSQKQVGKVETIFDDRGSVLYQDKGLNNIYGEYELCRA